MTPKGGTSLNKNKDNNFKDKKIIENEIVKGNFKDEIINKLF
jgi:hypothetical protein